MSEWSSTRARRVLAALLRMGWIVKRQSGSHRTLSRPGWPDFVLAFHGTDEIGPRMLARIAKRTGLSPEDLKIILKSDRSNETGTIITLPLRANLNDENRRAFFSRVLTDYLEDRRRV